MIQPLTIKVYNFTFRFFTISLSLSFQTIVQLAKIFFKINHKIFAYFDANSSGDNKKSSFKALSDEFREVIDANDASIKMRIETDADKERWWQT